MLPGVPSMPSLIYEHRGEYIQVLRAVDELQKIADAQCTEERVVQPDFSPMVDFLRHMPDETVRSSDRPPWISFARLTARAANTTLRRLPRYQLIVLQRSVTRPRVWGRSLSLAGGCMPWQ